MLAESTFADFRGTSVVHTAAGASSTLVQTLLTRNNVSEGVLSGSGGEDGTGATVSVERCVSLVESKISQPKR